ncbi:glycoside hydrolase family 128 protein, partial [Pleomassaria siparia CBS 279.74]
KRGVAFKDPAYTLFFKTTNSKVSWMYNWYQDVIAPPTGFYYVPMLWSAAPDAVDRWNANVDKNVKTHCCYNFLAFNEPDRCVDHDSACISDVGVAATAYKTWMQPISARYGDKIRLGSPAVTNGAPPMGLDYLSRFIATCTGCQIDFVAIHWYDNANNFAYFKLHVKNAYEAGGRRPVWITEFRPTGSEADVIAFLKEALPWLDSQDYVERYAYFM